jgi:cytochrome P450 family 135
MSKRPSKPPSRRPPGPRLPAAVQSLLFIRWPYFFVRRCQERYGDVISMHSAAIGKFVYLADPIDIEALFAHDGTEAHAGVVNAAIEPVTGPNSILLLDRERHLAERRLLSPAFHGDAIRNLEVVARDATERELRTWEDGAVLAARPAMQRITFEVICRAVLGVDDPALRTRLLDAFEPVFQISPAALLPAFQIDLGPLSPYGRFRRAMEHLDRVLFDLIAERRVTAPRGDILGMLLAATDADGKRLDDRHIRDEMVTLLLAGHETTATALAWALERLAHHPGALEEVRGGLAMEEDELIEAVAAETLRVRPVVMDVWRRLSAPMELGGYYLPAGTTVLPAIYLVHSDHRRHAQPADFDPQRFAGRRPSKDTWLPFGGGRRRCLGASLAQMELRVILSAILAEYAPEPISDRPEQPRFRGVTLAPARGARLRMHRRPVAPRYKPSPGEPEREAA